MSARAIIVVDDDAHLATLLREHGYPAELVPPGPACLEHVSSLDAAVVLSDVADLPLCQALRERNRHVLPIVVTARREPAMAIAAMRAGAYDYLTKPVSIRGLEHALARAVRHLEVELELERLRDAPLEQPIGFVAEAAATQRMLELVHRIAASDATVLVTGESGAGKERIAAAIHRISDRHAERFVAINCSAMTMSLLESELFGHVRGAFTGADHDRVGLFLYANRGTILLDEVADMPLEMQAKLLRVLQQRTVRPLGSNEEVPLEARIIAATSRDLEAEIAAKRFRKDLYHRINVVAVTVPPLRERREDILPLAQLMLRRCAARIGKSVQGMTPPTAGIVLEYDWPGNVRELESCMERAVTLCRLDCITVDDLPEKLRRSRHTEAAASGGLATLAEMKSSYLRKALALCGGNKSLTARLLDVDRRTISTWCSA